jgi:uncharacterized protein YrzB (UPF0473 family)
MKSPTKQLFPICPAGFNLRGAFSLEKDSSKLTDRQIQGIMSLSTTRRFPIMENEEILQEEEESTLVLTDENGVDQEFEYLDCIEYEGKEYLVLIPAEEDANEIVILEIEPVDEENENYLAVEDEAVLNAVYGIFKERFADVLTFED